MASRRGIGRLVGDDEDFARPGQLIDADLAEHLALRLVHIRVAGADDLVDGRNGLGSVGHCGDRLCAADTEDAIRARQVAAGDHRGVRIGRQAGDDFFAACDLRRHDRHHGRREDRVAAAGNVGADALDRNDSVTEMHAGQVLDFQRQHRRQLRLCKRLDARNRELGVCACLRIECRDGCLTFGRGDLECLSLVLVELAGVLADRVVAARAHRGDHALHDGFDRAQLLVLRGGGRLDAFDLQLVRSGVHVVVAALLRRSRIAMTPSLITHGVQNGADIRLVIILDKPATTNVRYPARTYTGPRRSLLLIQMAIGPKDTDERWPG